VEHPFILTICAFLMLMVLMSWVGYRLVYKPGKFLRQLGMPVIGGGEKLVVATGMQPPESSTLLVFLQQIGSKIPSSEQEQEGLKHMLTQAGFRSENAVPIFYGIRILCTGAIVALCLMMQTQGASNAAIGVVVIVFGAAVGWTLPRMAVERRVKKRQEIIRLSLPDALDLMVVSVEAGLGLDQAIQHVARELTLSHPELSEELTMVTLEMRAGKRRSDALRNFSERSGEPEVRKLVAIMVQNDRFGTSMGESLRTHSDGMRVRRRQEAEERAGKVGVKLVFPIFFFVLPSMLVVAAGPGILQIFKYLFPMMKQIGHK
jgi:tight adherence protein C